MSTAAELPSTAGRAPHLASALPAGGGLGVRATAALLLAGGSLAGLGLVCVGFVLTDTPVPTGAVLFGRWIPALVSLGVIALLCGPQRPRGMGDAVADAGGANAGFRDPRASAPPARPEPGGGRRFGAAGLGRELVRWWGLWPARRRPLLHIVGTSVLAMLLLTGVYLLAAALSQSLGAIRVQPAAALVPALLMMVPVSVVFAVSTLGEEVVWRWHLPAVLSPLGFWGSAVLVAVAWTAFHIPLHWAYAAEGSVEPSTAVALTAALPPLSLFLSALAARWACVWPAVFAHALPFTAVNLAANGAELGPEALWAVTGITAVLLVSAALVIAPVGGQEAGGPARSQPGTTTPGPTR